MNRVRKISRWAIPAAITILPVLAFASFHVPTVPGGGGGAITLEEVEDIIKGIARFLVVISIVVAVIFIVLGGVMYMAARGDEDAVKKAKTTITNGIIGAVVVLAVGVILQTLAGVVTRSFFGGFTG